jgi:membrane protein
VPSLEDRVQTRVGLVRERRPFVDHVVRTVQHYSAVEGSLQAGAVTYFAFLSFFPILALGFAVVGFVARIHSDANFQTDMVEALESVLPGMVSDKPSDDAIYIGDIQDAAPGILSVGLPILLYSGLGWLSAMREALAVVFEEPRSELPNFVVGKLRDLVSLAIIGLTLVVSVAVAGLVTGFSEDILGFVDLDGSTVAKVLLWVLAVAVGLAASSALFFALFKLLAAPDVPNRSLWSGALVGGIGFELLKQASSQLLKSTENSPATQAFGIALILLVWINYFSRVVMYAAAWAHMSPAAVEARERAAERSGSETRQSLGMDAAGSSRPGRRRAREETLQPGAAFALGGAAMLGAVALVRRTVRKGEE